MLKKLSAQEAFVIGLCKTATDSNISFEDLIKEAQVGESWYRGMIETLEKEAAPNDPFVRNRLWNQVISLSPVSEKIAFMKVAEDVEFEKALEKAAESESGLGLNDIKQFFTENKLGRSLGGGGIGALLGSLLFPGNPMIGTLLGGLGGAGLGYFLPALLKRFGIGGAQKAPQAAPDFGIDLLSPTQGDVQAPVDIANANMNLGDNFGKPLNPSMIQNPLSLGNPSLDISRMKDIKATINIDRTHPLNPANTGIYRDYDNPLFKPMPGSAGSPRYDLNQIKPFSFGEQRAGAMRPSGVKLPDSPSFFDKAQNQLNIPTAQ